MEYVVDNKPQGLAMSINNKWFFQNLIDIFLLMAILCSR